MAFVHETNENKDMLPGSVLAHNRGTDPFDSSNLHTVTYQGGVIRATESMDCVLLLVSASIIHAEIIILGNF